MQYTQLSRRSAGGKIDWEKQYLTFIPVEDAVFSWAERATSGHLEYSLNGGQTWVTIADGESTPTVTAGSKVIWRGNLRPTYSTETKVAGIGTFSATGNYKAYGNTMSLLYYDSYYGSQLEGDEFRCAFGCLFSNDINILQAPLLPATTLSTICYRAMFSHASNLLTAPLLPAIILTAWCYRNMFQGCTSLTTAPELPATTLASYCYYGMFQGCTSLTTALELPATILRGYCYYGMFQGCTSLNYVKCLATDIPASNCTYWWLYSVASSGTFVKAAEMENWPTGASGIPSGWTVVDDNS